MVDYVAGWAASPQESLEKAERAAAKSLELDNRGSTAYWAHSFIHLYMRRHDKAIGDGRYCIALNPNFAFGHATLGEALHYAGRSEEALGSFDAAIALNPFRPDLLLHFKAQAYFQLERFHEAIQCLKQRLVGNPESDVSHALLAACLGALGQSEEARAEWAEVMRVNPAYSLSHRRKILPYRDPVAFDKIVEGLRRAGLTA